MKTSILLLLTSLLLSSCATLMNAPTEPLTIALSEPARIVLDEDTLPRLATSHYRMVERSWDSLKISAVNNHTSKTIKVTSHNSPAYWLNLYPSTLWFGFMIDHDNPKRYSYPSLVYIDMNKQGNDYLTYRPVNAAYSKYNNLLKVNPFKVLSPVNAGAELSLERRMSPGFSTQLSATYLFQNSLWRSRHDLDNEIKGFQAGIEERVYLKKSAPLGPYLGLEFSYLKNKSRENLYFIDADSYVDSSYHYESYSDTIGISKQTYSLNLKYGYQYVNKRLTIDMSIGMGIRYKDVVHSDQRNPEDELESPIDLNAYYLTNQKGKYLTASFPFSIRIGWTF